MLLMMLILGCGDPCRDAGTVCTVVGDGQAGYNGDDIPLAEARLYYPTDVVARPGTDELYVTDWNNEKIRQLADGRIRTVVGRELPGDGAPDGADRTDPGAPGQTVSLNHPLRSEFGPDGNLYIAAWHNHKVRRWDPDADLVRIVVANNDSTNGNGANAGFWGDGGPAEDALLSFPSGVAFDPDGDLYVLDQQNLRVRRVGADGVIDTVAGCGDLGSSNGDALLAEFRFVQDTSNLQPALGGSLVVADDGSLYVADTFNHVIRRVADGVVETIAGTGEPGHADGDISEARFTAPTDLVLGPDGLLYVADTGNHVIRAIDLDDGSVRTVAGTGAPGDGADGLDALATDLEHPYGVGFAQDGAMLIADTYNSRIRRVTP